MLFIPTSWVAFKYPKVGWGKAESAESYQSIPKKVKISAVTTEDCFSSDPTLGVIFAPGSFCAGGKGFGPCTGDSGELGIKERQLISSRISTLQVVGFLLISKAPGRLKESSLQEVTRVMQ